MSETVHYTGTLIPTGLTVEQYMETVEVPSWCDSPEDYFKYDLSGEVIEVNGLVFKINRKEHNPSDDIIEASLNDDGTYTFQLKYYNSGCGFDEALEEALDALG